jgi:hypothetical protein
MIHTDVRPAHPARRPGRKRSALPGDGGKAITKLKKTLRAVVGDMPLDQLTEATHYSPAMVSAALNGTSVPSQKLTFALSSLDKTKSDEDMRELWFDAALEQFKRGNPRPNFGSPMPDDQLRALAWDLRVMMLREDTRPGHVRAKMEARAAGAGEVMSVSTLGRLLKGQTLPDVEQMDLLFGALGVKTLASLSMWEHRVERIRVAIAVVRELRKVNPDLVIP